MLHSKDITRLIEIMAALRTPGTGCPWDLEQTFKTIAPYTIEEAYEVADAIERDDFIDLKDELGDLLLQVVYHARMAEEHGAFAFGDVVEAITKKMIRRHPHGFGTAQQRQAGAEPGFWARIKAEEKAEKSGGEGQSLTPEPAAASHANISILSEVPAAMPALSRAIKLQDKAAKAGFDWPSLAPVFEKMKEELAELEEVALPADPRGTTPSPHSLWEEGWGEGRQQTPAQSAAPHPSPLPAEVRGEGIDRSRLHDEFGDLLFVMANVARHLKLDPEACLRGANQKFVRRFTHIETRLAREGRAPEQSTLQEMDALWDEAKALERRG